jgi:molybdopterin-guanine dinucleotide biosynthesis protein A
VISEQNSKQPPVYGLVLAGGKSVRMGQDKGAIQWHGIEQRYHMHALLSNVCEKVFISCRAAQKADISDNYSTICDTHTDTGPIFALLSAFEYRSDVAWMVVACDLPLIDVAALQLLLHNRNNIGIATTYQSPHDNLPEPLVTIWEPEAYALLQQHVANGFGCPRKVLIHNSDKVMIIQSENPQVLLNANTPDEAEFVKKLLANNIKE